MSASATASPIGLFGLGNMGAAVASRLRQGGPVRAYDPDADRRTWAAREIGVEPVEGAADMADLDAVVLCLPTPSVSFAVMTELCDHLADGSLVIETSTINPHDAWRMRDLAEVAGLRFVDAAILSGVAQMREGTSKLLIGGEEDDVARAKPLLDLLAERQQHFGPVGAGMSAKVINNAVAHAVMVVLVEAGSLATATGVRREDLADLLASPDAGLIRPLTHRFRERVLQGDFEGGMSTEAARKDSTLALELAQASAAPLFTIQAAHTVYELALAHGLGRSDYAAIARLWEQWTGREFADDDG